MHLLILVTGCASPITTDEPTHTPITRIATDTAMPSIPTLTLVPQSTIFPTATVPIQNTQTASPTIIPGPDSIEPISLQYLRVCPEQQIVPFEDLSLPQDIRLLVLPGDPYIGYIYSPLVFLPGNSTPHPIPNVGPASQYYQFSPDHQWIYFYKPGDTETYESVWVSSLDGGEQWQVMQINENNYAVWVSEQEWFIVGSPEADASERLETWEYMPYLSINPFTLEQRSLTYLAGGRTSGRFYHGFISTDSQTYTIYHDDKMTGIEFYLYDYTQEKSLAVFQWLKEMDILDLIGRSGSPPIWVYDQDKFAVTVERPYGIDLALNVDIVLAREDRRYSEVMQGFLIPEHLLPANIEGIIPGSGDVALRCQDANNAVGSQWFYVLDYQSTALRDYCFSLIDLAAKRIVFSPDGRFAAITFNPDRRENLPYIGILDLESGVMAYLYGYYMIDWYVAPQLP